MLNNNLLNKTVSSNRISKYNNINNNNKFHHKTTNLTRILSSKNLIIAKLNLLMKKIRLITSVQVISIIRVKYIDNQINIKYHSNQFK